MPGSGSGSLVSATLLCPSRSTWEGCCACLSSCRAQTQMGWSEWPNWTCCCSTPAQQLLPDRAEGSRVTQWEPMTRQVLKTTLSSDTWKTPDTRVYPAEFEKRVSGAPCAVSCRDNQGHRGDGSSVLGTLHESLFFAFWQVTSESRY